MLFGGDYYRNSVSTTQNFVFSSINIFDPVYLGRIAARCNPEENFSFTKVTEWFGLYFQDQIKLAAHAGGLSL